MAIHTEVKLAKTPGERVWFVETTKGIKHTILFGLTHDRPNKYPGLQALSLFLGPLKITVGFRRKTQVSL